MKTANTRFYLAGVLLTVSSIGLLAQPEQSGNENALNVATAIQSIVQTKSGLSDSAHHIRVTATDSQEVYLQGSVASTEERSVVENLATPFIEGYKLRDQLIVTSSINSAQNNISTSVRVASR